MRIKGYISHQFTKITQDPILFPRCDKTSKTQAKCKLSAKYSTEPSYLQSAVCERREI